MTFRRIEFKYDLFVSYANSDNEDGSVEAIVSTLRQEYARISTIPLQVYCQQESPLDSAWMPRREEALHSARYLLAVLTPRYFESANCRQEWLKFQERQEGAVIPIYLAADTRFEDPSREDVWLSDLRQRHVLDARAVRGDQRDSEQPLTFLKQVQQLVRSLSAEKSVEEAMLLLDVEPASRADGICESPNPLRFKKPLDLLRHARFLRPDRQDVADMLRPVELAEAARLNELSREAVARGDLSGAWDHLREATALAPDNEVVAQNLRAVEEALQQVRGTLPAAGGQPRPFPPTEEERQRDTGSIVKSPEDGGGWASRLFRQMVSWLRPSPPMAKLPTVDRVHFSVTSPSVVMPGNSFVLNVWAHLEELQEIIVQKALAATGGEKVNVQSEGPFQVKGDMTLKVFLRLDGMQVDDPDATILWTGRLGSASFRVSVPSDATLGSATGVAFIYAHGMRTARVNFMLTVGSQPGPIYHLPSRCERCKKAFASYASEDRNEVLARIQGMQKVNPGLEVFLDVLTLRSGQDWQRVLWKVIPENDIFYLFWSQHARASEWVRKEWQCALSVRGDDFIDPVPLVSPDIAPPPPELSSKHFNDWVLAFMRNQSQAMPDIRAVLESCGNRDSVSD